MIIPAQWGEYASYTSYRYDPVWAVCEELRPAGAHATPARPRTRTTATVPRLCSGVYASETVWWTSRPLWFMLLLGRVRALPDAEDGGHRSGLATGPPTCCGASDIADPARTTACARWRTACAACSRCSRASTSTATSRSARRTRVGASSAVATRSASATSCGATTSRIPRARGRTPSEFLGEAVLGHPDRRDRADPRAQPGRVLRLRPRQAAADRRPDRAHARGPRPDRRSRVRQVGRPRAPRGGTG